MTISAKHALPKHLMLISASTVDDRVDAGRMLREMTNDTSEIAGIATSFRPVTMDVLRQHIDKRFKDGDLSYDDDETGVVYVYELKAVHEISSKTAMHIKPPASIRINS